MKELEPLGDGNQVSNDGRDSNGFSLGLIELGRGDSELIAHGPVCMG